MATEDIYPLELFLSVRDVFKEAADIYFYSLLVKEPVYFYGADVQHLVRAYLEETGCKIQLFQALHYAATKNLLKDLQVKAFLLTYENNPWERMCIQAVREAALQPRIIGYQHTVVPQASLNMFISRWEGDFMPRPDLVLTTGDATRDIIKKYTGYDGLDVQAGCGLRFEYLFQLPMMERRPEGNCRVLLLALEGIDDVYKIVNYVLRNLKDDTRWAIVIRAHPTLPVDKFRNKIEFPIESMPRLEISKQSLKEDLERCDAVIYWGSTLALEALWMGKPIIQYDMNSLLSYDPLFECPYLKWMVTEKDDLRCVAENIFNIPESLFQENQRKGREYLRNYFFPITHEKMELFLDSVPVRVS